jgi:hypothetical protein
MFVRNSICVPRPSVAVGRLGANLALDVEEILGLHTRKNIATTQVGPVTLSANQIKAPLTNRFARGKKYVKKRVSSSFCSLGHRLRVFLCESRSQNLALRFAEAAQGVRLSVPFGSLLIKSRPLGLLGVFCEALRIAR